jgi:hypothetical protein
MINLLDNEDVSFKNYKQTFDAIDVDFSGMISPEELKATFEKLPQLSIT